MMKTNLSKIVQNVRCYVLHLLTKAPNYVSDLNQSVITDKPTANVDDKSRKYEVLLLASMEYHCCTAECNRTCPVTLCRNNLMSNCVYFSMI